MLDHDDIVGELLGTLDELGIAEDTIVMYPDKNLRAAVLIYLALNLVVGLLYARWHRNRLRRRDDARTEV